MYGMPEVLFYNYVKGRIIFDILFSNETQMDCTYSANFMMLQSKLQNVTFDNQTQEDECTLGCLQCQPGSYGCDVCSPFTNFNQYTGECDCDFKYEQLLYEADNYNSNEDQYNFNNSRETTFNLGFTLYNLNLTSWIKENYNSDYYNSSDYSEGQNYNYSNSSNCSFSNSTIDCELNGTQGNGSQPDQQDYYFYARVDCRDILSITVDYSKTNYREYQDLLREIENYYYYSQRSCLGSYVEYTDYVLVNISLPNDNCDGNETTQSSSSTYTYSTTASPSPTPSSNSSSSSSTSGPTTTWIKSSSTTFSDPEGNGTTYTSSTTCTDTTSPTPTSSTTPWECDTSPPYTTQTIYTTTPTPSSEPTTFTTQSSSPSPTRSEDAQTTQQATSWTTSSSSPSPMQTTSSTTSPPTPCPPESSALSGNQFAKLNSMFAPQQQLVGIPNGNNLALKAQQNYKSAKEVQNSIKNLYHFYSGSNAQQNDTYWGNQSQTSDSSSNCSSFSFIPYRTSRLYLILEGLPTTLIQAYQEDKITLKLKQENFNQSCSPNSYEQYILNPDFYYDFEKCSANKSCLLCSDSSFSCDVCSPETNKDDYSGTCQCKPNYEVEYEQLNEGRGNLYIDAQNIQVESYFTYMDDFNCSMLLDYKDFNNMSASLKKLIKSDLEYLQCEIYNYDKLDTAVFNSYFSLMSDQINERPAELKYNVSSIYLKVKNVSSSVYDALTSYKFSLYLSMDHFTQPCYSDQYYNYSNGNFSQAPYQITVAPKNQSSLVCSAGCDYCTKNKTCDLCDIFTLPVNGSRGSQIATCNCKFEYSMSMLDQQFDQGLGQILSKYQLTLYNTFAKNSAIFYRYVPCTQIMAITLKVGISNNTKARLQNHFNEAYCYLEASNYSTYNFYRPNESWSWYGTPIIQVTFFDIPQVVQKAFDLQYFNMTLSSSYFQQDCTKAVPLIISSRQSNQSALQCSKGCLKCEDYFECQTCMGNITVKDPQTGQCKCNYKITLTLQKQYEYDPYYQQYREYQIGVLEFYNIDLRPDALVFDWRNNYALGSVWSIFDVWRIISSVDTSEYYIYDIYQDLMAIGYAYFTEYDRHTDRVQVAQGTFQDMDRTYIRAQLINIPSRLYDAIVSKNVSLFINQNILLSPNYNCSISLNEQGSVPILSSDITEYVNLNYTCPSECEECDSFGFCTSCSNSTLTYIKYPPLAQASPTAEQQTLKYQVNRVCHKQCPISKFPNFDSLVCEDCLFGCGVCSSTRECFDCKNDLYRHNPYPSSNSTPNFTSIGDLDDFIMTNCLQECPLRTYQNESLKECQSCQADGCLNCTSGANKCFVCDPYLRYDQTNNQCTPNCSSSKQFVDFSGRCQECSNDCKTCKYTKDFCTSCKKGLELSWYNQCLSQNSNSSNQTVKVSSNQHNDSSDDNISRFYSETLTYNSTNEQNLNCSNTNGTNCTFDNCTSSNSNCNGTDNNNSTLICEKGTYLDYSENSCAPCLDGCDICFDNTSCLECRNDSALFWTYFGTICTNLTCPPSTGMIFNYSTNQTECKNCSQECSSCQFSQYVYFELANDTSNCSSQNETTEITNCTDLDISQCNEMTLDCSQCQNLTQNCSNCQNDSGNDTSQQNSTSNLQSGGRRLSRSLSSYMRKLQEDQNSSSSNSTQSGDENSNSTDSTNNPSSQNEHNCTNDTYPFDNCTDLNSTQDNQTSQMNDSNQFNCSLPKYILRTQVYEYCLECAQQDNKSFVLVENQCLDSCPSGYFNVSQLNQNGTAQEVCLPCPLGCLKCSQNGTCDQCDSQYYFMIISNSGNITENYAVQLEVGEPCIHNQWGYGSCPWGTTRYGYGGDGTTCQFCPDGCANCDQGYCTQGTGSYSCLREYKQPNNCSRCASYQDYYSNETRSFYLMWSYLTGQSYNYCVENCEQYGFLSNNLTNQCEACSTYGCSRCSKDFYSNEERCEQCEYGLILNTDKVYDNFTQQYREVTYCADTCYEYNGVIYDGQCYGCPQGCIKCSNPWECDVCNPFTVPNYEGICGCDFKHEIYPDMKKMTLTIDTLNLKFNNMQLEETNCSSYFEYTGSLSNSSQAAAILKLLQELSCEISFAHSRYFYSQKAVYAGDQNPYVLDQRTRIRINPLPQTLFAMFFNKTLIFSLRKDIFTQECDNSSDYSTQIILNEDDYKNLTIINQNETIPVDPSIRDPTIQLAFKLHNTSQKYESTAALRCQNLTVYIANSTGFNDGFQSISWSIDLSTKSGETIYTSNTQALTRLLRAEELRHYGKKNYNIHSNITSLITGDVQVKVTVYAFNKISFQVIQQIRFEILGSQNYVRLSKNGTTVSFLPQNGLLLDSSVTHPWCPSESKISFDLDQGYSKYCEVYKNISKYRSELIQNTTACQIEKDDSRYLTDQTYYVLMVVKASKQQGTIMSANYIKVSSSKPTCLLNQGQTLYTYSNSQLEISGSLSSDTTGTYYYSWYCISKDSGRACENFISVQTTTPYLKVNENTFTPGKHQVITMSITTPDLKALANCSMDVITYSSKSNCTDLNLYLEMNDANPKNYLSPSSEYNILCQSDMALPATIDYTLIYTWIFQRANDSLNMIGSDQETEITSIGNQLRVPSGILAPNMKYFISCQAVSNNQQACGKVNATYNTKGLQISLSVSPLSGFGMLTDYTLTVSKLDSEVKSSCSFGYINDRLGGIFVQLQANDSSSLTNLVENFKTHLPLSVNGQSGNQLRVYARCFDIDGVSGEATKSVNVSIAEFNKEIQSNINTLTSYPGNLTTNNIIMLSAGLIQYQANLSQVEKQAGQQKVLESLAYANQSQITEQQMTEISSQIAQITSEVLTQQNGTTTSSASTQQALAIAIQFMTLGSSQVVVSPSTASMKALATNKLLSNEEQGLLFMPLSQILKLNQLETDTPQQEASYQTLSMKALQNIVASVDSIIETQLTTNCSLNSTTTQLLIQSLSMGVNRASANMKSDSNQQQISRNQLSLSVKKVKGSQLLSQGVTLSVQPTLASARRLRNLALAEDSSLDMTITLPKNSQFSAYGAIVFKALQVNSQIQSNTLNYDANFASDILILSIEGASSPIALSKLSYMMQTLQVSSLENPVYFTVPLTVDQSEDTSTFVQQCMYFDTVSSSWKPNECQGSRISSTQMLCCSYHLTQFAVQTVPAEIGVAFERAFLIPALVILDILLVAFVAVACYLDKSKTLIIDTKALQIKDGSSILNRNRKQVKINKESNLMEVVSEEKSRKATARIKPEIVNLQESIINQESPSKLIHINEEEEENHNEADDKSQNMISICQDNHTVLPLQIRDSRILITDNFLAQDNQPLQLKETSPKCLSSRESPVSKSKPNEDKQFAKIHPMPLPPSEVIDGPKKLVTLQEDDNKGEDCKCSLNSSQYQLLAALNQDNAHQPNQALSKEDDTNIVISREGKVVLVERAFFEKYLLILQLYHRLIACFFYSEIRNMDLESNKSAKTWTITSRVSKSFHAVAQLYSIIFITALVSYYLNERTIGIQIAVVFVVMRITQIVSCAFLASPFESKSAKTIMSLLIQACFILAGHIISLIYGVEMMKLNSSLSLNNNSTTAEVHSSLNSISSRSSLNQWSVLLGLMLIIELVLWDFIIIPLGVIVLTKSSKLQELFNSQISKKKEIVRRREVETVK